MKLKCKACDSLCSLEIFTINGIKADERDFGEQYDADPDNADEYACANMKFFPKLPTSEVLKKYNITVDEYKEICEKLDKELSFGECGWCQ